MGGVGGVAAAGGGAQDTALAWRGFNHHWQNRVIGFQTPHRMGSIASEVYGVQWDEETRTASGTFHAVFTPGVNGDFAYPTVYYDALHSQDTARVNFEEGDVQMQFSDEIEHSDTRWDKPTASSVESVSIAVPDNGFEQVELLLAGFNIEMQCVETEGADDDCNSNGVWPTLLDVELVEDVDAASDGADESTRNWMATIRLDRGWTPSHGGGKSVNEQMAYNVTLRYTVVRGDADSMSSVPIFGAAHSTTHTAPRIQRSEFTADPTLQTRTVGMNRFGFQLQATRHHDNVGRYLEGLSFATHLAVAANSVVPQIGVGVETVSLYSSPMLTTKQSDAQYFVGARAMQFDDDVVSVQQYQTAAGAVCESDPMTGMDCEELQMEEQLEDFVPLSVAF